MPRLSLSFALLMTLAVAACGVKGPLELPPNAQGAPGAQASTQGQPGQQASPATGATASQASTRETWATPQGATGQGGGATAGTSFGWGQSNRQTEEDHLKGAEAPNRSFFLDWLL
ncbi:LPS translocon maturation chaperone LptM [Xanthobacter sp. TB0139]|uniref:LPS translocon maturation chaperone LptM n=1 Tax=Xanthobacter sp. TB0139 TaxID=3459178 RepID=UPI00403A65FB